MLVHFLKKIFEMDILKYIIVGGLGTVCHYVIMVVAAELLLFPLWLSTTIGFTAGAIVNYILNYAFTFKSQKKHIETAPKFFIIGFLGMLLNVLGLLFLIKLSFFEKYYMVAQLIATIVVTFSTFTLNKYWTFSYE